MPKLLMQYIRIMHLTLCVLQLTTRYKWR